MKRLTEPSPECAGGCFAHDDLVRSFGISQPSVDDRDVVLVGEETVGAHDDEDTLGLGVGVRGGGGPIQRQLETVGNAPAGDALHIRQFGQNLLEHRNMVPDGDLREIDDVQIGWIGAPHVGGI